MRKGDLIDPKVLKQICIDAQQYVSCAEKHEYIIDQLDKSYPNRIMRNNSWIWNNNGGGMAQLKILYASLDEYIALWGTSIGNNGHSGRYNSDVFDVIYHGTMDINILGSTKRFSFKPGDVACLPRGVTKQYRIEEEGWMIDYGRAYSSVVNMLPFAFADHTFSTLDYREILKMLHHYGKGVVKELFKFHKGWKVVARWMIKLAIFIGSFIWAFFI